MFKDIFESINDFAAETFYLFRAVLMGFFNGLINTIQTLLSIVGWLLESNGDKKLTGELYKSIQSKLEFVEDLLDLVCDKVDDFVSGITNLYSDFSFEKLKDTLSIFGNKISNLTQYDYAYFTGSFIFEVVLGVVLAFLTMGGSVAAEAVNIAEKNIALLRLIAREVISTATLGIVDILQLFRVLITKFAQACTKGWKGFKQFLENLFKSKTDDVAKEDTKLIDDSIGSNDFISDEEIFRKAKKGKGGGQSYKRSTLKQIAKNIEEKYADIGLKVEIVTKRSHPERYKKWTGYGNDTLASCNTRKTPPTMYLRDDATELTVQHEMWHIDDFRKLGYEKYNSLPDWKLEEMVWEKIWNQKHRWTKEELLDSYKYYKRECNEQGGIPKLIEELDKILKKQLL